jgi:hypothetical protein
MGFAVPQFQALYDAIPSQRNCPASAAFADNIANLQRFGLAVAIVNNNPIELNGRVVYADLKKAVSAGGLSHFYIVMIMLAVHVGLAKIYPVVRVRQWSDINQDRKGKKRNKQLSHAVCSPLGLLSRIKLEPCSSCRYFIGGSRY